jgi:hypothetical protein
MQVGEVGHMQRSSLAFPARAIQRKRIHNLSTGGRLAIACAAAVLTAAGCGSGGASGGGDFALAADLAMAGCDQTSLTCQVSPNAQATLAFVLTQGGRPAAGQAISFAIIGSYGSSSGPGDQGAIVGAATGVTDAQGLVSVTIQAGSTDFRLQAQFQAPAQPLESQVTIVVATGPTGTVLVAPFLTPAASPLPPGTTLQILFYNRQDCANLHVDQPEPSARTATLGSLSDPPARFTTVETTVGNAAIGVANSGNGVVANGCVDIPGSSVIAGQTVEVALPLSDASPDPVGSYHVKSTLTFAPPLAAAAALAVPWADLADCPLDPAQLWLDCTVDALAPAAPDDPLDCVPAPGSEGALGDAIAALRGVPLTDGTGAPTGCRSARDAAGDPALDARVLGLFGSPAPPALVALPAIAADAASILDSIQLESTLVIAPGSTMGGYAVTHTLTTARFGPGWQIPVTLATLALPTLQAFTSATVANGALVIGSQDFTLRLGSAARAAFGPLSLVPRGLPADVPSFVSALFALAQAPGGSTAGCAGLDALVCPAAGAAAGCLLDACAAGLGALTDKLDGAFAGADGTGIDLSLSGSASLIGPNGVAERLGTTGTGSSPTATWSATLRTSLGSAQVVAPFEGVRN